MPEKMCRNPRSDWDVPVPHVEEFTVCAEHIDRMGHVNNSVYLKFVEQTAWAHTRALGLTWQTYRSLDAGFVVRRHELDYLAAAMDGERLRVATWIADSDRRLTLWRGYQIRRVDDGRTLLRARTQFVCVRLSNGRPRRMPPEFVETYQPVELQQ